MKLKYENYSKNKGFTLIELLVVIAIIAILAAVSIPIATRVFNKGKEVEAVAQMKDFVQGCNDFYKDHGSLTNGSLGAATADTIYDTDSSTVEDFIAMLSGKTGTNNTGKNYINIKEAKGDAGSERGGLIFSDAATNHPIAFVDPWGNGYQLILDYDYNDQVNMTDEKLGDFSNKIIGLNKSKYLMISYGSDGADGGNNDLKSN